MKLIITADWHFGHPGRLDDLIIAFKTMIKYCLEHDIKVIVIAGDLTHDRESMTHDVSNAIHILFEEARDNHIEIVVLIGNHDMFYRHRWSVNAVKPFAKQVEYISNVSYFELDNQKFWVVPFIEHEQFYMKVIKDVNKIANEDDILITHIGIAAAKMNNCFLVQNWSVVSFEETKFKKVYAGHFHNQQKVGSKSWCPGSPIPFRFDEGLVEHGFIVLDTKKEDHEFIELSELIPEEVRPPDYITINSEDVDSISGSSKNNCIKIILKDGDDKDEIKKKLPDAIKVVFVKPKEEKVDFSEKPDNFSKSNDMFESWISHDNPDHLSKKLLISLEKEVRSESRFASDD